MNGIGNANSINFTATMDVSEVRNNKERWENVAKIFEQKTQKYEDTFTLSALDDGEGLLLYAQTSPEKERGDEHCAEIFNNKLNQMFNNMSDEAIAKKFVKMLKVFRHYDTKVHKGDKFVKSFMKGDKYNDQTHFKEKFYDILIDKTAEDMKNDINSDPVLKEFKVY